MKKNIIIGLFILFCFLYGCGNKQAINIDDFNRKSENGLSANESFNEQIENAQYILNLQNFLQKNDNENIKTKINTKFDEKSTLQGGFNFSKDKILIGENESSEISFDIVANSIQDKKEPFEASGSLNLLYKDNEVYVQLHNFGLFMGEENINAKMYTLLLDLIHDKRVNLEVHSGGIVQIDEKSNPGKLAENLKNILIFSDKEGNSEFLSNLSQFLDTINGYISLGISTENLSINSPLKISYSELENGFIQKTFTGYLEGKDSAFNFSFSASAKGINIKIFNIKSKNDGNFEDLDSEIFISLNQTNKKEYKFKLESLKLNQKVIDCEGIIEYGNIIEISGIFILEPIELIAGQKISGKLTGTISKDNSGKYEIPELTGNILLFSELLKSLQ